MPEQHQVAGERYGLHSMAQAALKQRHGLGLAPAPLLFEASDERPAASRGMLPAENPTKRPTGAARSHVRGRGAPNFSRSASASSGGGTQRAGRGRHKACRGDKAGPPHLRPGPRGDPKGRKGPGRGAFINPFPTGRLRKRPPRPCAASRARAGKGWRRVGATRGGGAAGAAPSSPSPARRRRQEEEEGAERRHGGQHVPSGR